MAISGGYGQLAGRSPVSASIKCALEHQGVLAPHTGMPFSEALLAGVAGGICFGYFIFHYEGHNPQVNIITRNSFHGYGWDSITDRLRIARDMIHSTNPQKAEKKLVETLENGLVPIVFADVFTLGYEHSELGEGMWAVQPMVVLDYDSKNDRALIADRSISAHAVSIDCLQRARGRIKKDRYRMAILSPPNESVLQSAVLEGIRETLSLFTEKPPKGSANNFGFKAYEAIISNLSASTGKGSWSKRFTSPPEISSALFTAYKYSQIFWKDPSEGADRLLYSDFLNEAAEILENAALKDASGLFQNSALLWKELGTILLPDSIPELGSIRNLANERNRLFISSGAAATKELGKLDREIDSIVHGAQGLSGVSDVFNAIAQQFRKIADVEMEAITFLSKSLP